MNIPNLPCFRKGYKSRPLPLWFLSWISKQKLIRYKDLLVPCVQFKVVTKDDSGGVFVGCSIKGKDVYGSILVFPDSWGQSLTTDSLCSGFQEKLSRHLNMISKGCSRGTPQHIKSHIDSLFLVSCLISPRPKLQKTRHTILRTNAKGQVVNKSGQIVGTTGNALFKISVCKKHNISYISACWQCEKDNQPFNPSKRD